MSLVRWKAAWAVLLIFGFQITGNICLLNDLKDEWNEALFSFCNMPAVNPSMSDCISCSTDRDASTCRSIFPPLCSDMLNPLDVFGLDFYKSSYCLSCRISLWLRVSLLSHSTLDLQFSRQNFCNHGNLTFTKVINGDFVYPSFTLWLALC